MLAAELSHNVNMHNLCVFGSAARGEAHEESDLDLVQDPAFDNQCLSRFLLAVSC